MESNHRQIIQLIRAISGQSNVLTIPRVFIGLCKGSHRAALLLSQCVYWSDKGDDDGWFFKTRDEWKSELGLNQHAIATALKVLPWVETTVKPVRRTPKTHYRVDMSALAAAVAERLDIERKPISDIERKPINVIERKTINLPLGKTTTPKTTDIKGGRVAAPPKVEPVVAEAETAMGEAVRRVTGVVGSFGVVKKTARLLVQAGYTAADVDATYTGDQSPWRRKDWRGKKGDAPTVFLIPQTIGALCVRGQGAPFASFTPPTTPEPAEPEPPPAPRTKTEQLWDSVLASIQGEIPRATFDAWLAQTQLATAGADAFTVVAPTSYGADWLRVRMNGAIKRTLARVANVTSPTINYTYRKEQ